MSLELLQRRFITSKHESTLSVNLFDNERRGRIFFFREFKRPDLLMFKKTSVNQPTKQMFLFHGGLFYPPLATCIHILQSYIVECFCFV